MVYLVADIGATNARFSVSDGRRLKGEPWIGKTDDYTSGEDLLPAALAGVGVEAKTVTSVVLAVAGPVKQGAHGVTQASFTNSRLVLDAQICADVVDCPVDIVNDFYAQARGVPHFTQLVQIGGDAPLHATKAVLGAGSGLGMATLTPVGSQWQVLCGEGGHADLAPGNHLESELWSALTAEFGHVSWERVLSGPGLVNLYRAMCATWGQAAEDLAAQDVVQRGQDMSDLVCHQTLETFAALLGAAASNLAVTVGAVGGIYIGGGIAPRITDFLLTSPLRRRFEEKGVMSDYLKPIPILVVQDAEPGLIGAQACLSLQG